MKEPVRSREATREFVSIAVHDLREPLRAIRASSEMLLGMEGMPTSENASRCLRYIRQGVDRMESLIQDIAEYLNGELRQLEPKETGMEAVLMEAQRQLAGPLKANEATLTHDLLPSVTGDFFALATVFRCLIENACKFRGKAAPLIHIGAKKVRREKQRPEWVFSVRDNGIGFNPAYADRIFKPFERLNGKQYPGSGLGLPLAKSILEQHGGRIWVDSTPGEGSTFWFSLPAPNRGVRGQAGRAS